VRYEVIHISSVVIDTIGIAGAIRKAIATGMKKLTKGHDLNNISVLLDGGLRLGAEYKHQKTIIKGDEKKKIIAWASILAKVSRDAVMARLSKRYLEYGFGVHKGYGTLAHRNKIKECGLSPIHRRSFCRKFLST
jgi:ribonuclease HII